MKYFLRRRHLPLVAIIDSIGGAYAKIKRVFVKPKQLEKSIVKKILVMSLDLIGDGILATPSFRTLKENFPKAEITALVGTWNKEIFENNPDVDKVKIINPFWTRSVEMPFLKRLASYLKIYFRFKKDNYDLGIDLRGEFLSILLMKRMGAEYAVGYGITGGGWLLDKCADYKGDRFAKHIVERNLDLLRALDLKISDNLDLAIYPDKKNKQVVDKFFAENGISSIQGGSTRGGQTGDKIAVIHPGSNDQARCWDNGRWAEAAIWLIENGHKVILSGGPADEQVVKSIKSKVKSQLNNINPESLSRRAKADRIPNPEKLSVSDFGFRISDFLEFSILDLAELIKRADLLLCVNSAALHIGAAMKTPAVVLFAGSYPRTYGPWPAYDRQSKQNPKSVVLFKDAPCFPCGKAVCENNVCMKRISIKEVVKAVESLSL